LRGYNRSAVPELPDLAIVADALHAALAGRPVSAARAPGPLAVRGTPGELEALVGQRLTSIRRRGKLLIADFERDRVVINPMLTGRLQLASPGAALPTKTAVVLGFGPRARRPRDAAKWTARAPWLPADDGPAEVRYRDPTQMGKVYLVPAGVTRIVPGLTDEEKRDLLATVIDESERLNRFIANLLDMTKLESGAIVPIPSSRPRSGGPGSGVTRASSRTS